MQKEKLNQLDKIINSYKTISQTDIKIEEGKFIKIGNANYTLANGRTIYREEIIKNNGESSAVIILPVTTEGEVILAIQPRVLTKEGVKVELPAGYIDQNETGEEAALRELKEETGYIPEKVIKLGEYYYDQGCCRALSQCFLALNCQEKEKQSLDGDEMITIFKCTYEEMLELMDKNYINDAGSIIAIEKSKAYLNNN